MRFSVLEFFRDPLERKDTFILRIKFEDREKFELFGGDDYTNRKFELPFEEMNDSRKLAYKSRERKKGRRIHWKLRDREIF